VKEREKSLPIFVLENSHFFHDFSNSQFLQKSAKKFQIQRLEAQNFQITIFEK